MNVKIYGTCELVPPLEIWGRIAHRVNPLLDVTVHLYQRPKRSTRCRCWETHLGCSNHGSTLRLLLPGCFAAEMRGKSTAFFIMHQCTTEVLCNRAGLAYRWASFLFFLLKNNTISLLTDAGVFLQRILLFFRFVCVCVSFSSIFFPYSCK